MPSAEHLKKYQFKPGVAVPGAGRKKGETNKRNWKRDLQEAIELVETVKKKRLMVRAVELAWNNPSLMSALLKKLLPDQKFIESNVSLGHDDWVVRLEEVKKSHGDS